MGSQSSLGVMFTDREVGPYFNRVGGIDGRFKLNSNWVASFQGVVSSTLCSDTRTALAPSEPISPALRRRSSCSAMAGN